MGGTFGQHESLAQPSTIVGAALFGIGWGLSGVCPGPSIAGLGAGSFELAHVTMTQGIHLGTAPTAEALLARWNELANRDGEMVPGTGFDQARHELRKAGFDFDAAAV